jgi:hypothetical protein
MRTKSASRERLELDADREAALELGDEVGGLRDVERAGGDEQHVIGLDRAVLGRDGRALDDRQQIALHALARDVGAAGSIPFAAGDLVDLVEEDDAVLLGAGHRVAVHAVVIDQLVDLLLGQSDLAGVGHLELAATLRSAGPIFP